MNQREQELLDKQLWGVTLALVVVFLAGIAISEKKTDANRRMTRQLLFYKAYIVH